MVCFVLSTFSSTNLSANAPQTINITLLHLLFIILIISFVKGNQYFIWDPGFPCSTLNEAFNSKTPCFAQLLKLGFLPNTFSIFLSDGGYLQLSLMSKHKPVA